jgi:hypothetical protein
MKNKIRVIAIITGWLFYSLQIFSQTPDFSGKWILNFEKSNLEHKTDGLTGTIFIIKQEGNKFKWTRYHIFGEKKKKISFKMTADGKIKRVKLLFKAKLQPEEKGLVSTLWRKNFSNVVHYKFGSSQNELIADEVFKSKANNHHNIWVLDREIPQ